MECCFQILFLNEVTFKSCDVTSFHHCTDICVVIVYSFYVPGVFRVQKQMSVGALSIVSTLVPNICFSFELSVLLYFPALSGPLWNRAAKRENKEKRSFWSLETLVRQQCSAIFSFYTTRHANVCCLLFYIFSCRKNSSQLYDRRKEARKADTWFPGSRRCFRHCGLQIDLPVYWSGRSHPSQENNLPGLNLKGSNPFESAYLEEPRYSKDLCRECVF